MKNISKKGRIAELGTHEFTLRVKTVGPRRAAEWAVLSAFAGRKPDGCEFYLYNPAAPRKQTDTQIIAGGLATIAGRLMECGLGEVNLGKLARHMLKLRAKKFNITRK